MWFYRICIFYYVCHKKIGMLKEIYVIVATILPHSAHSIPLTTTLPIYASRMNVLLVSIPVSFGFTYDIIYSINRMPTYTPVFALL